MTSKNLKSNFFPKITIVTPNYNLGEYLEETILSVLNQNYPNLEYIIIDGESTDNSVEIIKKYEKWIDYWISEPDNGQAHAINKGLKRTTGEIFNWLNSDDWLEEGALFYIAKVFKENPNINVVCGRMIVMKNDTIIKKSKGTTVYYNNLEKTLAKSYIEQPCTFFRFNEFIIHTEEKLSYLFDVEIWIKYLLSNDMSTIFTTSQIIAYFRLHEDSKTSNNYSNFLEEKVKLTQSLIFLLKPKKEYSVEYYYQKKWLPFHRQSLSKKKLINLLNMELFELFFALNNFQECQNIWSNIQKPKRTIKFKFISLRIIPIPIILLLKKIKYFLQKN
jgi:glycosyltransferase involved in cell wall biosynthesis